MASLAWTVESIASLRNIHDFIARDRPRTAMRTIESIISKAKSISKAPERGQLHSSSDQVRVLTYGHFRIAYHFDQASDSETITILAVFHGLIFLPLA